MSDLKEANPHQGLKYLIIRSVNTLELEKRINNMIEDGWVPQGGLAANPESRQLAQAMVRREVVQ